LKTSRSPKKTGGAILSQKNFFNEFGVHRGLEKKTAECRAIVTLYWGSREWFVLSQVRCAPFCFGNVASFANASYRDQLKLLVSHPSSISHDLLKLRTVFAEWVDVCSLALTHPPCPI
jgi:hypothetical protein